MKCTNRSALKRTNKNTIILLTLLISFILLSSCDAITDTTYYQTDPYELIMGFENEHFNRRFSFGSPFTSNIAVASTDIPMEGLALDEEILAGALFSINNPRVMYGYNMFEPLYPASTTKVMTALVAIHHGNMEDIVTISENAVSLGWYAQMGGLRAGDQVSMGDLVAGLMLHSGNDNAIAIAEHISGTEEAFVQLMNEKANTLGATHTNFANSHGLHDENQFSTLYDLYLIFNSLARDRRFLDVIAMPYIAARITDNNGEVRYERWYPTNWYNSGVIPHPDGVTVLGGKTGTTDEAGACLILFSRSEDNDYYISIIMGAPTRDNLYRNMTFLLSHGIAVRD